ncbi:MAG: aspartyl/asparaginyl beta-hydroxylase domain-containing protein [Chitinophagaceae bacterium]|nr:aspartyl/asparaginyl beta-hydroxylase domain-containing protein [Chitinophagaceae bacterium]
MIKYLQLPFHFDASLMQQEIRLLEKTNWQLHYQVKHYEGEWSALPLRSTSGKADDIIISPVDGAAYHDTELLQQCPYLKEILSFFHCPLLAVRLLKLNAGAVIKEHRDAELYFEKGEIRIHIPVKTNDRVEFYLDNERILLKEGECWYMNFNLPHRISNNSKEERIHLVIDAMANDWVKELFAQPGLVKKEIADPQMDAATQQQVIAQLRSLNTETASRLADEMEKGLKFEV